MENFNLKNVFLTSTKKFSWKKWPQFARFQTKKRFQISRFFFITFTSCQKYGKFRPEIYFWPMQRNFHGRNDPNSTDFEENNSKSPYFYDNFHKWSRIWKDSAFFLVLLSYLVCSQIWLNHLMDDHHFSHITKLKKNNAGASSVYVSFFQISTYYYYLGGWGGQ
jgi:hypothetical protein